MERFLPVLIFGLAALLALARSELGKRLSARLGLAWMNLHPDVQRRALDVVAQANEVFKDRGLEVGIFNGWRDLSQQEQEIREGDSFVSHARQSFHVWGLAVDFVFRENGQWTWLPNPANPADRGYWDPRWNELGAIIERNGFEWGGRWRNRDGPHAQLALMGQRPAAIAANFASFEEYRQTWA